MSPEQKKKLRAKAHHLKPVVLLGDKGFTDAVLAEMNIALDHHELIKIKVPSVDQEGFQETLKKICEAAGAELVQAVGHTVTLYRRAPTKKK